MDSHSEARLGSVHPVLAARIRQLDQLATANGLTIGVSAGLRTWAEQDALFAQVPQVTKARGGWSAHNFGYAVDVEPGDPNFPVFHPDWNAMHPSWQLLLNLAKTCGLAEGAEWRSFPDKPHLYLQELPATPTEAMRQLYQDGGMDAVWESWATLLGDLADQRDITT
jgi:peptidoglycan L-alanyl-D-glutamate endopeptidase CwlK